MALAQVYEMSLTNLVARESVAVVTGFISVTNALDEIQLRRCHDGPRPRACLCQIKSREAGHDLGDETDDKSTGKRKQSAGDA